MILNKTIKIYVKSSVTIHNLNKLGIESKIGDVVHLETHKLWKGSNIKVDVKCDICGFNKNIQFNAYNKNIKKYGVYSCSNRCSYFKNKKTNLKKYGVEVFTNLEKVRKTKLKKYGNEKYQNVSKIKEAKLKNHGDPNYNNLDKIKETNLKKYGVECTLLTESVKNKIKKTSLEKYGNSDFRKSDIIKEKRKKTNLLKYNTESYMHTKEFRDKSKETNLKKYGVDSSNKSDIIKEKKRNSMLKKYGYISNSCTEESKRRLRETNMERYGVEYPMQVLEFYNKQQKNSKKVHRYNNNNLYYQGSYEQNFLEYMDRFNLIDDLTRCPTVDYLYEGNRKYYPDFYFDKLNLIIEIKSSYYLNKFYSKNMLKKDKCINMGYNFLFIIDKKYDILEGILVDKKIINTGSYGISKNS